jgi:hypothetical protein
LAGMEAEKSARYCRFPDPIMETGTWNSNNFLQL